MQLAPGGVRAEGGREGGGGRPARALPLPCPPPTPHAHPAPADHPRHGLPPGFGFVSFSDPSEADAAARPQGQALSPLLPLPGCAPWQCPRSAAAPPRGGAPGGSGRLGTPGGGPSPRTRASRARATGARGGSHRQSRRVHRRWPCMPLMSTAPGWPVTPCVQPVSWVPTLSPLVSRSLKSTAPGWRGGR